MISRKISNTVVWKFNSFLATLILREIQFGYFEAPKTTILDHFSQWRHPRGGYGALAPPIFGTSISKNTKLAPKIGQIVCLVEYALFSKS